MSTLTNRFAKTRKSVFRGLAAPALAVLLFGAMPPASNLALAQSAGSPHEAVVEVLRDRHGEAPAFIGLASDGAIIEVFTSKSGETWTIVRTRPDGVSQVVAIGEFWEDVTTLVGQPI